MRARATLKKDGVVLEFVEGEIQQPGDLYDLVQQVYELARQNQRDLWNSSLEVTKA